MGQNTYKKPNGKKLLKLPKFELSLNRIMSKMDIINDVYTYDSDIENVGYARDRTNIVILTTDKGYITINAKDVNKLSEELDNIKDDIYRQGYVK